MDQFLRFRRNSGRRESDTSCRSGLSTGRSSIRQWRYYDGCLSVVDGIETTSYVAFYNFGDVGQSEDDRIVSGYTYDGVVIPQIMYLDGDRSAAIRDDGFTLYKGSQVPKEVETIKVDKEIVSTFYDDNIIGLVFKNGDKDKPYTMRGYSTDGSLKFEKKFNIPYTTIKASDGNILLYNSSQISVMNSRGVEKYSGTVMARSAIYQNGMEQIPSGS